MTPLLDLSRRLHEATSLGEVMDHVVVAITAHTRYQRAWLLLPHPETRGLEVIGYALADRVRVAQRMAALDIAHDRWVTWLLSTTEPIVVEDLRDSALADQDQVAYFGNRTLITVPMLRLGERIGVLCVGTFAAEGVIPPTEEEIAFVVQIGALVSAVAGRIRAEVAQRELEDKVRGAQRLEALGRMAGEIAHDFNNMLLSIILHADLARRTLAEHPADHHLEEIEIAAGRAAGLTRQLLAFSRGQPLERRDLRLDDVVGGFVPMLRSLLPSTIELEVTPGSELRPIYADAGQLEQVVMNLVVNARDAVDMRGRIVVTTSNVTVDAAQVQGHPSRRPGDYVMLSVSDTGIGMSPETSERVFEPFFTTKVAGGGTGLGLAVVDSIVRRHEGFIEVDSEPGIGTTFRVYLPVSTRPGATLARSTAATPVLHGTEHVLVVDDDTQVRTVVMRVLDQAGYRVTAAEDGRAALDILEHQDDVRLVISDLAMPRLAGDALWSALRARPQAPQVLIMSGYAPGSAAQGAFEHVLAKPFAPRELLRKVREVLDVAA